MTEKTLMFGIGATKAGTSWLHQYLSGHPECAMPGIKELHYFDGLENGGLGKQVERLEIQRNELRLRAGLKSRIISASITRRIAELDRWISVLQMPGDATGTYIDFLMQKSGNARLVGDITPAYGLLPAARLATMSVMAPDTRFVYILRDPVDWLWSQVRMVGKRRAQNTKQWVHIVRRLFDQILAGENPEAFRRCNYADTLARLDQAVPQAQQLTLFFENLFNDATVQQLCRFLGLSYQRAATKKPVHVGKKLKLDDERRAAAQAFLAPQYAAVARRFETLPTRWQDNMVKV